MILEDLSMWQSLIHNGTELVKISDAPLPEGQVRVYANGVMQRQSFQFVGITEVTGGRYGDRCTRLYPGDRFWPTHWLRGGDRE